MARPLLLFSIPPDEGFLLTPGRPSGRADARLYMMRRSGRPSITPAMSVGAFRFAFTGLVLIRGGHARRNKSSSHMRLSRRL